MGAAIVRGYLDLTQSLGGDTSLAEVDSAVFIDGAQQGSFLLRGNSIPIFGLGKRLLAQRFLNLDLNRPAMRDMTPDSSWYNAVNQRGTLPRLHYYNFIQNYRLRLIEQILFWQHQLGFVDLGDSVILPGTDNPRGEPWLGGAGFLPFGSAPDEHEYVMTTTMDDDGWLQSASDVVKILADPANHWNIPQNSSTVVSTACDGSNNNETIDAEIIRIVGKPANAC
jgi:hypothetical protein